MDIASYIDHTLLRPTLSEQEVVQLCNEANQFHFAAVCVPPPMIALSKNLLNQPHVKIATVIGFPFGYSVTSAKLREIEDADNQGADEFDTVINLIHLKSGKWSLLEEEMRTLVQYIHDKQKKIKVIIESGILTEKEIIDCCNLYGSLGIDFLKTSTGYAERGASLEAVRLMRKHLPPTVKIKASGGIRNYDFAKQLIDAGASRLGCSASVSILSGRPEAEKSAY
jgi:deoxyribose-phosphate aldolase